MGRHPLKNGLQFLRSSSRDIRAQYNAAVSRSLHLTGVSGIGSILMGIFKILFGVLSLSVSTCVNGFYTLGMVIARYCALAGVLRARSAAEQCKYYRWAGRILILSSLLYMVYSAWSYFHPRYVAYHMYIALAIATVTFTEIGVNLRGVLVFRKNRSPLLHALKIISLATSLISLVLTQAAILSFADDAQNPEVTGITGVLMGACAALLGVYMLLRLRRIANPRDCRAEQKAINRLVKKRFPAWTVTAAEKQFTEQGAELVFVRVSPPTVPEGRDWEQFRAEMERKSHFQVIIEENQGGNSNL